MRLDLPLCSIEGCERPKVGRGLCGMHYRRWRLNGDPTVSRRRFSEPVVDGRKRCTRCNEVKPVSEFHRHARSASGFQTYCKACGGEAVYELSLLRKFGIELWQYEAMVAAQEGRCGACGRPPSEARQAARRLCVDHDHETGHIRGLLCRDCNYALGMVRDDPVLLRGLAAYLERAAA